MSKTRSHRRWIQFTLKGLLIATALLALWLGRAVSRARNQAIVVADVRKTGGSVWFETDQPRFVEYWLNPERIPSTASTDPGWLRRALGEEYFRSVVQIDFKSGLEQPTFKQLGPRLGRLSLLETIRLEVDESSDELLAVLVESSNIRRLKNLHIDGLVTDIGLKHIGGLSGLETLNLRYTEVTDEGVAHLAELKNLHSLFLYSSAITERGAATMLAFPSLKKLILYDCAMTEDEFAALKKHHSAVDANVYYTLQRVEVE